ncbi:Mitochondrial translocator assembly and maintenance protein 41 [Elasticomyces elasticus]|nr:Mitochondrial translocator assembly and maintenance protein 41 [Elasticomyces elasticus]KAK3653059.1 Mitochondrial translocator assembly and maintenance protein 41 [Elasticomyces elasticus]KAK4919544.1 Mitochondrial translocator assembly and maintenance protein 41 [Elasticomyces elasticus]KAK5763084.1 Mitochondrial translocator assembly and maintenance protein 41 [Elasticomyces elasticus]
MALPRLAHSPGFRPLVAANSFVLAQTAYHYRPQYLRRSFVTSQSKREQENYNQRQDAPSKPPPPDDSYLPAGWEDSSQNITTFSQLPHRNFGHNQHIKINDDFKESLRQILWQFRAPIRYAFAYGSGVFSQSTSPKNTITTDLSPHPNPPKAVLEWQKNGAKIIDFIFGVSHTQHWHSLNLTQHPSHYSGLKHLPWRSAAISHIQDDFGAGVYFNPYITVNGTMIKYGVVNLSTLATDLTDWNTLYLAGRLQKPVKILRDDPRIRLANQVNLISALRTALLMLPERFTERTLYERIAGLSYLGDPRMTGVLGVGAAEDPGKVSNIVGAQLPNFRQLYVPLIENLPNVSFDDPRVPTGLRGWEKEDAIRIMGGREEVHEVLGGDKGLTLVQDMDPVKRGNMVRRLPKAFRRKLYFSYKKKFGVPGSAFDEVLEASEDETADAVRRREGGEFERRIAGEEDLSAIMAKCVQNTVSWPSSTQSIKGIFTGGLGRSWRYYSEKRAKGKGKAAPAATENAAKAKSE